MLSTTLGLAWFCSHLFVHRKLPSLISNVRSRRFIAIMGFDRTMSCSMHASVAGAPAKLLQGADRNSIVFQECHEVKDLTMAIMRSWVWVCKDEHSVSVDPGVSLKQPWSLASHPVLEIGLRHEAS